MIELEKQINKIKKSYFSFADLRKVVKINDNSLRVAISRMLRVGKIKSLLKDFLVINKF